MSVRNFLIKNLISIKDYAFAIGIYVGDSPLTLKPNSNNSNPALTNLDVNDVNADFVADPFMVLEQDKWYMFFEVWNSDVKRGEIGLAMSDRGYAWQYDKIILKEPFHLSYPYVFRYKADYYMIPETRGAYSVRLYKAKNFPYDWTYEATLMYGNYVDASIFQHRDVWYIFVTDTPECNSLRLYYSTDLYEGWVEHPQSPLIMNNPHIARPAGRIVHVGDKLYRFSQDDYPKYGLHVNAYEINKLSTTEYEEKEVQNNPILKPDGTMWNNRGMHHIDAHFLNGNNWIACVDGWSNRYYFLNKDITSIVNKFKRVKL